jgi:hypothetical protein
MLRIFLVFPSTLATDVLDSEPGPLELLRYLVRTGSCVIYAALCVCVRGGGEEGKVEERYEEKNGGPSTPLKYVATVYFPIPLAKPSTFD